MEFLPHKNSNLQHWTRACCAVRTQLAAVLLNTSNRQEAPCLHVVFLQHPMEMACTEHCSCWGKIKQEGDATTERVSSLVPFLCSQNCSCCSCIRLQKYSGVKPNSQNETSFQITQFRNSAQHYQGTAADLSVPWSSIS